MQDDEAPLFHARSMVQADAILKVETKTWTP